MEVHRKVSSRKRSYGVERLCWCCHVQDNPLQASFVIIAVFRVSQIVYIRDGFEYWKWLNNHQESWIQVVSAVSQYSVGGMYWVFFLFLTQGSGSFFWANPAFPCEIITEIFIASLSCISIAWQWSCWSVMLICLSVYLIYNLI